MKDVTPHITEKNLANYIPIPECGCWFWLGHRSDEGYGMCRCVAGYAYAHRVFFAAYKGPLVAGMHVLHKCDTPACVNPDHLFLGTHIQNMADQKRKNRHAFGEQNAHASLTDEMVMRMREEGLSGQDNFKRVGKKLGLSHHTIRDAVVGRSWTHLPGATRPELRNVCGRRSEARRIAAECSGRVAVIRRSW